MELSDLSFPIPTRSIFEKTVVHDWYDGVTSAIATSLRLRASFKIDIVAWGPRQETRVFVLSPFADRDFETIEDSLSRQEEPKWPIWFPAWAAWSSGSGELKSEIKDVLSRAKAPEYAAATDSMFETILAAWQLDNAARDSLPSDLDGLPSNDNFDDWKRRLHLYLSD